MPTETKHTPGPWEFGEKSLHIFSKKSGEHLATIHIPLEAWEDRRARAYADAKLMVSAPTLAAENAELRELLMKCATAMVFHDSQGAQIFHNEIALVNSYLTARKLGGATSPTS